MDIKQHIRELNEKNDYFKMAYIDSDEGLPLGIEVRFDPTKYSLSIESYEGIVGKIEENALRIATVDTSEKAFRNGVITIKLSSMNKGYSKEIVKKIIDVIQSFFKNRKKELSA